MFSDIHHGHKPRRPSTHRLSLILTGLIAVIALVGLTATYRPSSASLVASKTVPVAQSLDVAALGSARTLLIASFETPTQASRRPVMKCSPFGSLTACAANHFATLGRIKLHSPA